MMFLERKNRNATKYILAIVLVSVVMGGVPVPSSAQNATPYQYTAEGQAATNAANAARAASETTVNDPTVKAALPPLRNLGPSCSSGDFGCYIQAFFANLIIGLASLLQLFLLMLLELLLWIGKYNGFLQSPVVTVGWVIIRDLANLFFILILLAIAFSTIVGSEKLHYKQHLVKLLLMAIMINFSKMITGIFIDFSQVLLMTFGNAIGGYGSLSEGMGLIDQSQINPNSSGATFFGLILSLIFNLIFLIFAIIVIGLMFVLFLARILALWIITMTSPFAFFLSAFPQGQQYAGKWWSQLSSNLISGPVLMFFLWLTLKIQKDVTRAIAGVDSVTTSVTATKFGTADVLVSFAITMGLLIAGIKMAVEAGGAGASVVGDVTGKIGQGIKSLGKYAAKGAGTFLGTEFAKKTGIEIRPSVIAHKFQEAMAQIGRTREQAAQEAVQGRWQEGGFGAILAAPGLEHAQTDLFRGFLGYKGVKEFIHKAGLRAGRGEKAVLGPDGKVIKEGTGRLGESEALDKSIKSDEAEIAEKNALIAGIEKAPDFITKEGIAAGVKEGFSDIEIEGSVALKANTMKGALGDVGTVLQKIQDVRDMGLSPDQEKPKINEIMQKYLEGLDMDKLSGAGLNNKSAREMIEQLSRATQGDLSAPNIQGKLADVSRGRAFASIEASLSVDQKSVLTEKGKQMIDIQIQNKKNELAQKQTLHDAEQDPKKKKELAGNIGKMQKALNMLGAQRNPEMKSALAAQVKKLKEGLGEKFTQKKKVDTAIRHSYGAMDFEVIAGRRALVEEDKKKVNTTNEDELIDMFHAAMESGNQIRAMAIASQAADVGHLNELVNDADEKSDIDGLYNFLNKNFGKEEGGMGMDNQMMLSFMNDLSNKAEAIGHWNFGQAVGSENGLLRKRGLKEQTARVYVEVGKRNWSNAFNQQNRLGLGTEEWIDKNDRSKGRKWTPSPAFLLALKEFPDAVRHRSMRGEFNANTMMNIGQNYKSDENVRRMFDNLIEEMKGSFTTQGAPADVEMKKFLNACVQGVGEETSPQARVDHLLESIE